MVELLERLGHEVEFRPEQTCCGQMHMNSGYGDGRLELAARMRRVFDGAEVIVTPSASCAGHVLEHEPGLPVHELSQFLTGDRKSTRLNSSHVEISYAVFCLKKKKKIHKRNNNYNSNHLQRSIESLSF